MLHILDIFWSFSYVVSSEHIEAKMAYDSIIKTAVNQKEDQKYIEVEENMSTKIHPRSMAIKQGTTE